MFSNVHLRRWYTGAYNVPSFQLCENRADDVMETAKETVSSFVLVLWRARPESRCVSARLPGNVLESLSCILWVQHSRWVYDSCLQALFLSQWGRENFPVRLLKVWRTFMSVLLHSLIFPPHVKVFILLLKAGKCSLFCSGLIHVYSRNVIKWPDYLDVPYLTYRALLSQMVVEVQSSGPHLLVSKLRYGCVGWCQNHIYY